MVSIEYELAFKGVTNMTSSDKAGLKYDGDKLKYHLVPPEAIGALAAVLTFGANKYTESGWRTVPNAKPRYFSAAMRHLWSWWNPLEPDFDEESGYSHLWHALTNIAFLTTIEQQEEIENVRGT